MPEDGPLAKRKRKTCTYVGMADNVGLKPAARKGVRVRISLGAQVRIR